MYCRFFWNKASDNQVQQPYNNGQTIDIQLNQYKKTGFTRHNTIILTNSYFF